MRNHFHKSLVLSFLIIGCGSSKQEKPLADLNLYFDSEIEIDSVLISNITQDREFQFIKFSNAINVDLNDSINDLYAISFYSQGDHRMAQLWLDGNNLMIKGKVSDKMKIEIDTVIGSDLYYKSLSFREGYKDFIAGGHDSSAVNGYLIDELKREVNSPFSIEIANTAVNRSISDKEQLEAVFQILATQSSPIKKHLLNPLEKIERILTVNKIDFSEFKFHDAANSLSSITLTSGRKYLVDFWFVGCAPCIEDHKSIIKKMNLLDAGNVSVIGISVDKNQNEWKSFLTKKQYPWRNYREVDEHEKKLRTKMMIDVFPTYLLLDDQGVILYRSNTFSDIEKILGI